MAQKSLGSWLRETVRLPGEAVETLIPKLIAKQVCEVRHLKILREAGGLETLFLDRPTDLRAVSAALDQLYPPAPPASAAVALPEPLEPSQPLQPARTVAAPATTSWSPPPADAPAVYTALVGAGGSQAPSPQSMGVPGGSGTGSPRSAPPGPSTTEVKAPNSSPNTLGYARDFGMEHPYAMAATAAAAAAAATAAAHAAAVKAALPPASVAPGVQPPAALPLASVASRVQPPGDAVPMPPVPTEGHAASSPGLPAPPGPPGPPLGVADHAAAAMAQAAAAAAAASATASAAMVQSPAQRPAAAPRPPPARPPPFPPAVDPIQERAKKAAADANREGGAPPPARREGGAPPQPQQPALPQSPPQQPTRSPTEPLCGFVPYQLSAEMYANIYRNPAAFGYPEVASGTVARPKFGYIFVETRAASGRRPKLLDGLDWIPSSATNAKHKLLRDGKTELVRQYCTRRTKSDAAKAAATAWGHFVREVVDTVKAEHPGKTSYEIKAITGDRWRALPENDPIKVRAKAAAADANRFHRQRLARADPVQLHVKSAVLVESQHSSLPRPSRGSLPASFALRDVAAALPHDTRLHALSHIRLQAQLLVRHEMWLQPLVRGASPSAESPEPHFASASPPGLLMPGVDDDPAQFRQPAQRRTSINVGDHCPARVLVHYLGDDAYQCHTIPPRPAMVMCGPQLPAGCARVREAGREPSLVPSGFAEVDVASTALQLSIQCRTAPQADRTHNSHVRRATPCMHPRLSTIVHLLFCWRTFALVH